MIDYNNYFTHHKIEQTDSNIDKEQYFDDVAHDITQATELLGSILYDLKATIYNHPDKCGFDKRYSGNWKEKVVDGLEAKIEDVKASINVLDDHLDDIHSSMDKWDRETFIDKLAE